MINSKTFLNGKWLIVIKFTIFLCLFFITGRAGLNGIIYPFVFGVYFALIWCNQNVFLVSITYLLANYLVNFSLINLLVNIIFCIIFMIFYGIHYKVKKPIKVVNILIYACLCNIPKIVFNLCY